MDLLRSIEYNNNNILAKCDKSPKNLKIFISWYFGQLSRFRFTAFFMIWIKSCGGWFDPRVLVEQFLERINAFTYIELTGVGKQP